MTQFSAGAIVGTIGLDPSPQVKAIKVAIGSAHEYRDAMQNAGNGAAESFAQAARKTESRAKEMAENIKQSLGKRSALGEWAEILAGGGALLGLSLVSEKLNEAVNKAGELAEALRQGKANAFDVAEGIAKAVPVFGSFYELGRNVRDLFTGEKEEMKEVEEAIKAQNEALAEQNRIIKEGREAQKQFADEVRTANQHVQLLQTPNADARNTLRTRQDRDNAIKNANEEYEKGAKPTDIAAKQKEVDDLARQQHDKRQEIDAMKSALPRNGQGRRGDGDALAAAERDEARIASARTSARAQLQAMQDNEQKLRGSRDSAVKAAQGTARNEAANGAKEETKQMGDAIKKMISDARGTVTKVREDVRKNTDAEMKRAEEQAKGIRDSVATPAEKLHEAIQKIQESLSLRLITPDQASRATDMANKAAYGEPHSLSLNRSGSAESQGAQFDAFIREHGSDGQLGVLQSINQHLQTIAGNTRAISGYVPDTYDDMPFTP